MFLHHPALSRVSLLALLTLVPALGRSEPRKADAALGPVAEFYVKLALAMGVHDGDFVDAYYGPAEWPKAASSEKIPLAAIQERERALRATLAGIDAAGLGEMSRLRREYLDKQLRAMDARIAMLQGNKVPFDEESSRLYDAVAPTNTEEHFQAVLTELEKALPGAGPLAARVEGFRRQFIIPPDKLDLVFRAAIAAARARTQQHIALPAGESFTVEYVTGKPWAGYNWYKGGFHSVIQVNTDLPVFIDRAIDLACHEGYPGHHVYNVLLEKNLLGDRGWIEFCVYPLFSPQSLIAEGSANYGIDVAFPGGERVAFERAVLFPLAGFEPARAAEYRRVEALAKELDFAGNEAARRYLNGEINAAAAAAWISRFALMEPARAQQRVRFIDQYRSYVINYNLGEELVRQYVETRANGDAGRRWAVFKELISSPRLPSGLK